MGSDEINAIARFLGLEGKYDFIQRFTRLRPHRDGLELIEKPNNECIFLDGRDCAIQPVKPMQCAGFPNTWNFPGWREVCEAVPSQRNAQSERLPSGDFVGFCIHEALKELPGVGRRNSHRDSAELPSRGRATLCKRRTSLASEKAPPE